MNPPVVQRQASRVLVLDRSGCALLMGVVLPPDNRPHWFPPGGGGEPGEDSVDTACRELFEETGLAVSRSLLGEPVARTAGNWTALDGTVYSATDTYFYLAVDEPFTPDISGFTEFERGIGAEFRWWTADEIDATSDVVYPVGLTGLMRRLRSGDVPAAPLDLPWS